MKRKKKIFKYFFGLATRIALVPNFSGAFADYSRALKKKRPFVHSLYRKDSPDKKPALPVDVIKSAG